MYVCMYVCMYVYIDTKNIHTDIYIYTHELLSVVEGLGRCSRQIDIGILQGFYRDHMGIIGILSGFYWDSTGTI